MSGPLTAVEVRTKTCCPQTMGELHARPGTSIDQAMFSSGPQVSGSAGSSATTPDAPPRNCGQFDWADTLVAASTVTPRAHTVVRIVIISSATFENCKESRRFALF